MPVVAAAVCPHPPILVPELAAGAAPELAPLRQACLAAVDRLTDSSPDSLLMVGSSPGPTTRYAADASGSFGPYGAPQVRVHLGAGGDDQRLPLAVLVGAWLVRQSKAAHLPTSGVTVDPTATPAACEALGRELARTDSRVALLVMGDGSARRSEHAPVHLHPRAEIFDATVATALATADSRTLAALDPDLAAELHAAGRAPWQVLAAAAGAHDWRATLLYDAAPYGVGYFVSGWER